MECNLPALGRGRHGRPFSSQSGQAGCDDTHARTNHKQPATRNVGIRSASRLHRGPRATKSRTPRHAQRHCPRHGWPRHQVPAGDGTGNRGAPSMQLRSQGRTRTVPAAHAAAWLHSRSAVDLGQLRELEAVSLPLSLLRGRRARSPSHARARPPPKGTAVAAAAALRSAQVARQRRPAHTPPLGRRGLLALISRAHSYPRPLCPTALAAALLGAAWLSVAARPSRSSCGRSSAALLRAGGPELDWPRCSVSLRRARDDGCASA